MKDRTTSNMQLVAILLDYLEKYPDIRFSQALSNLDYVEQCDNGELIYWVDDFYLEPDKLLERVTKALEKK